MTRPSIAAGLVGLAIAAAGLGCPASAAPSPQRMPPPPAPQKANAPVRSSASTNVRIRGPVFGVNIAGCSFVADGTLCPTPASVRAYLDKGFTMVRLPFKGPQMADPVIRRKLVAATRAALDRGAYVVLDRHDYSWPSVSEQVAFWTSLMASMPRSDRIIIDPMNEPKHFDDPVLTNDWDQWARDTNQIIAGLRAAGIRNVIAPEYPGSSATFRLRKREDAAKPSESALVALDRAGGLKDPLGLTIINGHRYFDKGSSGTQPSCTGTPGYDNFAYELRARGLKGIITESAFGRAGAIPPSCEAAGAAAIAYLKTNADTVVGVTWWGGGAAWNERYLFKIEPKKGSFGPKHKDAYLDRLLGR